MFNGFSEHLCAISELYAVFYSARFSAIQFLSAPCNPIQFRSVHDRAHWFDSVPYTEKSISVLIGLFLSFQTSSIVRSVRQ